MADPAPSSIAEQLQARIATIDTEMERVKARALVESSALRADRAVLMRAATALASIPDGEAILAALKKLGVW